MAAVIIDDRDVTALLTRVALRADDLEPFFALWGPSLVGDAQRRFDTGTDPDGRSWIPLALSTRKRKTKKGRTRTLVWDGHLRTSITFRASRTMLEVGTPMSYGPTHQFGARIERHAQTKVGSYRRWRDVTVKRADGTAYTAKRFAGAAHKRISMMARTEIGAGVINIPARPFLGLSAQGLAAGRRLAERHFAGGA
jgi:phage gpG-like protein